MMLLQLKDLSNILLQPLDSFLKSELRSGRQDLRKPMDKAWKEYETRVSKMREERRKREFSVNSTSTLLNVSSSNSTTALTSARSGTLPVPSSNDNLFDSSVQQPQQRPKGRQSHLLGSVGSNLELSPPYPPDEELEKGKRFLQLHLSEVRSSADVFKCRLIFVQVPPQGQFLFFAGKSEISRFNSHKISKTRNFNKKSLSRIISSSITTTFPQSTFIFSTQQFRKRFFTVCWVHRRFFAEVFGVKLSHNWQNNCL